MQRRLYVLMLLCCVSVSAHGGIVESAVACDESNEPLPLLFGDHTENCAIEVATDLDNFQFVVSEPDTAVRLSIFVSDSDPRFFSPRMELRDAAFNVLFDQSCNTGNSFSGCAFSVDRVLQPGTYLLAVSEAGSDDTANYQLQLEKVPGTGAAPNLPYDFARIDRIDPATDVDFYSFDANASSLVRLTLRASGSDPRFFDPRLEIRGIDGMLLDDQSCATGNTFSGCTFSVDLNITTAGSYQVAVSESGTNRTGDYELSLACLSANCPPATTAISAAVLPASRSPAVGSIATVFATIVNGGGAIAAGCTVTPTTSVSAEFSFSSTNAATNEINGLPDSPVDVAIGGASALVFSFEPTAEIPSTNVEFSFDCINTPSPAPVFTGINTLLLSASNTPTPDVVALAATTNGNLGIAYLTGVVPVGAFSVATVNLGADSTTTVMADTGSLAVPAAITICETNPATSVCLSPPAASVTTQINTNDTPTFGIFLEATGDIPLNAATSRIFVRFIDESSTVRGATSVAVTTDAP